MGVECDQAVRHYCADSGVSSIDDFSRDEFKLETEVEKNDEEESNATRSSRRTSSRSSSRGRRSNDKPVTTNPMAGAEKVMETYRFTSEITASYEALTALLNGIAADKNYFLWLRKIRIENERQTSPSANRLGPNWAVPLFVVRILTFGGCCG